MKRECRQLCVKTLSHSYKCAGWIRITERAVPCEIDCRVTGPCTASRGGDLKEIIFQFILQL